MTAILSIVQQVRDQPGAVSVPLTALRYGGAMRIATWNVNSIRARAERIGAWLDRSDADVLAIQELKCKDAQFPHEIFDERGYEVAFHGLNQWNGVAIASRVGLDDVEIGFAGMPGFGEDVRAGGARDLPQ